MTAFTMQQADLDGLLAILRDCGYTIVGPRIREAAVVLDVLTAIDELPRGWRDRQAPGVYALNQCADDGFFQYTCGPHSWKRFLYPSRMRIFGASFEDDRIRPMPDAQSEGPYAFLGMRACDLKAQEILDRVLSESAWPDPYYRSVRRGLFIIAVNCLRPGGTCFCAAMGAGPGVASRHDILLNEIGDPDRHCLIAEAGSREGAELLLALHCPVATTDDLTSVRRTAETAARQMKDAADLSSAGALYRAHFDHPHWQTLAERCLACGNCTLVCPTCFCHTVTEIECLDDQHAERRREWDSCFSKVFSYIHGGSIRPGIASRYRQWLCHKLSTWPAQFGTPGCVGCGRCRTWCPAGIDLVAEVEALVGGKPQPAR